MSLNCGGSVLDQNIVAGRPSSTKRISIVTLRANWIPLGLHSKTRESFTKPAGASASVAATVISVGAATAPGGNVTVAPPTRIEPPSGEIDFVTAAASVSRDPGSEQDESSSASANEPQKRIT